LLRDSFKDGSCLEATKNGYASYPPHWQLAVENRGQRVAVRVRVIFSFRRTIVCILPKPDFLGAVTVGMKTAVEKEPEKLIKFGARVGDDFLQAFGKV